MTIIDVSDWHPSPAQEYPRPATVENEPFIIGHWNLRISNPALHHYVNYFIENSYDLLQQLPWELWPQSAPRERSALVIGPCTLPLVNPGEFLPQYANWEYLD